MNTLTFSDIFIGNNGIVVLISSMLLALGGNLFKKYQRYSKIENPEPFNLIFLFKDNWDDMVAGFFVTYIMVRLLSLVTPYVLSFIGAEEATMAVSDTLVLVSVLIGYYSDGIIEKLTKKSA